LLACSLEETAGQSSLHASEVVAFLYRMRTGMAASRFSSADDAQIVANFFHLLCEGFATILALVPLW